jgi:hypothetical protein
VPQLAAPYGASRPLPMIWLRPGWRGYGFTHMYDIRLFKIFGIVNKCVTTNILMTIAANDH